MIAIVIIAIGGYFFPKYGLGVVGTRFPNGLAVGSGASITTAGSLVIGANGSSLNEVKSTTCNLSTVSGNLPLATTTAPFYCAITGVASGDQVFVSLPSDATSAITLKYATASTTDGYIEVGLAAVNTSATASFSTATTSVQVLYIDN